MEVEKRGGAKGGFFQLFDWNGKSRKKLFSAKSDLPENSNHGREAYHSSVLARQLDLENGFPPNVRGHNDYYYASSTSGDSEYGTKAPGVVARLMGLDSLPTQNATETCFTAPFADPQPYNDSGYVMAAPAFQREHDIVIFESVRNKLDGSSRNPLDLKLQRAQNRSIERFQKEVLPPKSAKPISVTQHRLLSPIKSPGFVPPKNAAYIIEAASKMIEQSPRSNAKANYSPLGSSSSVPIRIRDLKEKMEAAQRSSQLADLSQRGKEQSSVRNVKKQVNARGQVQLENGYSSKGSEESKRVGSQRLKSKEKSGPLASQGKVNIQKRDRLNSVGNRSSEKHKEHNDARPGSVARNLTNTQKRSERQTPARKPSEVLRTNNQKQNCVFTEDGDRKERKEAHISSTNDLPAQTHRTVDKIVVNNVITSRKTNFVAADQGKELSSSKSRMASKKKVLINGNIQTSGSTTQKAGSVKDERSVKHNVAFADDSKWDMIDKKSSLDVVSFTFSSPIKKSVAGSNSCGFNVAGGDALSALLEQKLKELTSRVELSQKEMSEVGSSGSTNNYGNLSSTVDFLKGLPMDGDVCKSKRETGNAADFSPDKRITGLDYVNVDNDNRIDYQRLHLQGSLSVSCRPSSSGASFDSYNPADGRLPCLSLDSYEGTNWSSTQKSHSAEGDTEISDTASSSQSITAKSSSCIADPKDPSPWELDYIKDIVTNADLLWEEFALGQAYRIIPPDLFEQLENHHKEEPPVLERRALFDCICECLEDRCGRVLAGSWKLWAKGTAAVRRREWLAEEVCGEVAGWMKGGDEMMVDEVVERDMSWKGGKWIEFETEWMEEGVAVEDGILTNLIDELIDDFLL
ncbi:uncharacterized protein LOC127245261 [Andrographis paniculata]|uniref:uncharacterized protein LOC127245261 n=1 Tax=Andrographis paniculata TaxID=175694 RepID=UPI0021E97E39|nr:uncharacterized protein LOC127245261 [Andrographis paniculata]XP_051121992.1 uncharacterized protein LOC127245261 [Andrographis paniculata]